MPQCCKENAMRLRIAEKRQQTQERPERGVFVQDYPHFFFKRSLEELRIEPLLPPHPPPPKKRGLKRKENDIVKKKLVTRRGRLR